MAGTNTEDQLQSPVPERREEKTREPLEEVESTEVESENGEDELRQLSQCKSI